MRRARRGAHEHFIGGDPHDGPMPMDYFVWVAKNADRAVVIDIGFTAESGGKRGRRLMRDPIDSLAFVGVDPADVKDVILTHMHYDHVGNFHKFPVARFHLQEPEIHYAVGRYMRYRQLAKSFEPDDVCGIVRLNFDGPVVYRTGPGEVVPGDFRGADRRAFGWAAVRQGEYAPRDRGVGLRRDPLLREHGDVPPVHHCLPYRRDAGCL